MTARACLPLPSALMLVACLCAPAYAQEPAQEPAQAPLRVYNWSGYIARDTIPDFMARTQTSVAYHTYDTLDELDAVLARRRTGYDVIILPAHKAESLLKKRGAHRLGRAFLARYADALDPGLMKRLARFDTGNAHVIAYASSMMGFAYNAREMAYRRPDAANARGEVFFDPGIVSAFADCGVGALNTPSDVWTLAHGFARAYGNATPNDIDAVLGALWPFIRRLAPSADNVAELQAGGLCLAMARAADVFRAQMGAAPDVRLRWTRGKASGILLLDVVLIPKGAHVVRARRFIEHILEPQIAARLTLETGWASAVLAARALLPEAWTQSRLVYPPPEARASLPLPAALTETDKAIRARIWARFKHAVDTNTAEKP